MLFQNPNKEMLSALRQCVTTKTTKTPTACIEIRFMPDFMCEYEVNRVRTHVSPSDESRLANRRGMSGSSLLQTPFPIRSELDGGQVLILVKWDLKSIKQCVKFVTSTYEVVLISVFGNYVWMIKPTDLSRGLCEASIVGEAEVSLDWIQRISLTERNRYWEKNKNKRKREDEQAETDEQSEDDEQTEDNE